MGCVNLKVALYARVSTTEQTTENQIIILKRVAEARGWDYTIIEETMTTRRQRPKKAALLKSLRLKEYDAVCILKLDRWARSLTELVREVEELHNIGILFISVNDNIDLSSPSGKLQFQILAAFAEFERNIISERTKEGLARKRATGWVPHRGKDKRPRRKSGYYARYAHLRKDKLKKKKYGEYPKQDTNKGGGAK